MNGPLSRLKLSVKLLQNVDAVGDMESRPVEGPVNAVLLEMRVRCRGGISTLNAGTSPGMRNPLLPVTLADDLEALTADDCEDAAASCLEATLLALDTMAGTSAFTLLVRKRSLLRNVAAVFPKLLVERARREWWDDRVVSSEGDRLLREPALGESLAANFALLAWWPTSDSCDAIDRLPRRWPLTVRTDGVQLFLALTWPGGCGWLMDTLDGALMDFTDVGAGRAVLPLHWEDVVRERDFMVVFRGCSAFRPR